MDLEENNEYEEQKSMLPEVIPSKNNQKNKDNLPWVEKYRPTNLSELISHKSIIGTINRFIEEKKLPNLLFYGPPGTGKTSTIVACAKQMYGNSYNSMALELNASDDRGIDVVRKTIKEFASTQNIAFKGVKLVILDECDSMTAAAQFALRRIIEKYAKNTRFCLICNYVSKIIPALQSRCTRFKFKHIPEDDAKVRVKEICVQEKISISEKAIDAVFKLSEGDMRKVVNMLQSISISMTKKIMDEQSEISEDFVYQMTGNVHPRDIDTIFNTLLKEDLTVAFGTINSIKTEKGLSLGVIIKDLNILVMNSDLPTQIKKFVTVRMAELEYRCSLNCSEKIMLGSLVASFLEARSVVN